MPSELKVDFGSLYRKAFAEKDPATKQVLLEQVQAVLNAWHQNNIASAQTVELVREAIPRPPEAVTARHSIRGVSAA